MALPGGRRARQRRGPRDWRVHVLLWRQPSHLAASAADLGRPAGRQDSAGRPDVHRGLVWPARHDAQSDSDRPARRRSPQLCGTGGGGQQARKSDRTADVWFVLVLQHRVASMAGVAGKLIGFGHPPPLESDSPLSPARKWTVAISVAALILCVMPVPIAIISVP